MELFSRKNSRILIITNEENDNTLLWIKESAINIDHIALKALNGNKNKLTPEEIHNAGNKKGYINQDAEYDLIILDRICESPLLVTSGNTIIWKDRQELFHTLSKRMPEQSTIILFSENATYLRKLSSFFYASINFFLRTSCSGVFISQLIKELKKAGFSGFNCFYIYPELTVLSQLISDDKKAFGDAMKSKYGLPFKIYRHPRLWLRWLSCYLQLNRLFLPYQMIWIKK